MPSDTSLVFYLSYAALWILVVFQGLILLGLLRMVSQRTETATGQSAFSDEVGLRSGQVAPKFSALDLSGAQINSKDFVDHMTALLFVSPNCPSCTATLYEMEALSQKAQGNLILICRGKGGDCSRLTDTHKLEIRMVADEDERISRLFGVSSFPTAVLVNESNRIQSYGRPKRSEELQELLDKTEEIGKATEAEQVEVRGKA
jgi:peroxiredoxin